MMKITLASPADVPDILTMVRALSAFHGDTAQVTQAQLHDIFFGTAPMGTALIAKQYDAPVGYAGLTGEMVLHHATLRLDIHHLFVHESHRRQGVGTALIQAAKTHARTIGATRLTIGTDANNALSIAAYRTMGNLTEITGTGPRFKINLGS